jgi:hypothetical protein
VQTVDHHARARQVHMQVNKMPDCLILIENFRYLQKAIVDVLNKNKEFDGYDGNPNDADSDYADVGVIELLDTLPKSIVIGKMSDKKLTTGSLFRFGGFGCEKHNLIPAKSSVNASAGFVPKLKYAQGKITTAYTIMAVGPTYTGEAAQSACPGDSGGPVYFDPDPSNSTAVLTEYIGINHSLSRGSKKNPVKSQIIFTMVTTDSPAGKWVNQVLDGKVKAFDSVADDNDDGGGAGKGNGIDKDFDSVADDNDDGGGAGKGNEIDKDLESKISRIAREFLQKLQKESENCEFQRIGKVKLYRTKGRFVQRVSYGKKGSSDRKELPIDVSTTEFDNGTDIYKKIKNKGILSTSFVGCTFD